MQQCRSRARKEGRKRVNVPRGGLSYGGMLLIPRAWHMDKSFDADKIVTECKSGCWLPMPHLAAQSCGPSTPFPFANSHRRRFFNAEIHCYNQSWVCVVSVWCSQNNMRHEEVWVSIDQSNSHSPFNSINQLLDQSRKHSFNQSRIWVLNQ